MSAVLDTVRVFVSSTFRDTHAERDQLVTVVFPELRERLEILGLNFYDIDLRWGVPEVDADGELVNTWTYCKQSIDNAEPFFISILGQRYGQIPSAEEIDDDMDCAEFTGMSITEMEIRHAVLSHRLTRRSFFYFRATRVPKKGTPPNTYTEFVDHNRQDYLEKFKKQIQEESGRPVRFYECHWTGKGFSELNDFGRIVLEDLWSGVLRDERYVSKDAWYQVLGHEPDADPLYTDDSQPIPQEVWQQIVERAKPAPLDPLDAETKEMAAFATSHLRWFQGRRWELQQLMQFIDNDLLPEASHLCVVKAVAGQGKSTLLAKLARMVEDSSRPVISHFVGATESSPDTRSLLDRLVRELDRNGIPKPIKEDFGEDLENLKKRLAVRLESYDTGCRIVLIIDAVNQLTSGHDLSWLPLQLGSNVRIIISCIDDPSSSTDSPEERVMVALRGRFPEPYWIDLTPLDEEDVREIVNRHLIEYSKRLDSKQIEDICRMDQARNPLYLLVMLHALRILAGEGAYRKVPNIIANMPIRYPNNVSLFDWILDRLAVLGKEAVRLWCIYLSLGRIGMSSRELSDLLAHKLGKDGDLIARRIERGIRQYLQRRGGQLDFFHEQLRRAVARRYLPEDTSPYHADISVYLQSRWQEANVHALSELPYHQTYGELWDELETTLSNLNFIEAKCASGMTYDLIHDYNVAMGALPEAQEDKKERLKHEVRLNKYIQDLVAYSRGETDHLEIISSVELWSKEKIRKDTERTIDSPTRFDRIRNFSQFVISESHALARFASQPAFVAQHAYNLFSSGPVADAADHMINTGIDDIVLLNHPAKRPQYNPHPASLVTIEDPIEGIWSIAITPDGRKAISGTYDGSVKVWDLESGECIRTLEGHSDTTSSVCITPDGRTAVAGCSDGFLIVWDLESGECLRSIEGHSASINSISITADGRTAVSGSSDRILKVWDLGNGECLGTLEDIDEYITCNQIGITADGSKVLSSRYDDTIEMWDLDTGDCIGTLRGRIVSITPDGKMAISASTDNTLKIWDLESGQCLRTLEGHADAVWSVCITPDGRMAVSGSDDKTLKVWDIQSGECLRTFEEHSGLVVITADGRRVVSVNDDGKSMKVWDLECGMYLGKREGHSTNVGRLGITPDGTRAIVISDDNTIDVWELQDWSYLRIPEGYNDSIDWLKSTPDGRVAVSGSHSGSPKVWDLESGQFLRTLEVDVDEGNKVSITPDGKRVVISVYYSTAKDCDYTLAQRTLRVWDLESGKCLRTLEGDSNIIQNMEISPDGKKAIAVSAKYLKDNNSDYDISFQVWDMGSGDYYDESRTNEDDELYPKIRTVGGKAISLLEYDSVLKVWDLKRGECLRTLKGHGDSILDFGITSDGKRAISASWDKTLKLWDLESGECLWTLKDHKDHLNSVSITPDGKRAVSASADSSLKVWNLETRKCLKTFEDDYFHWVKSITISPDGRRAVSTSENSDRLRVWNLETGKCLYELMENSDGEYSVIISPDSRRVISVAGDNSSLHVWDLKSGEYIMTFEVDDGQLESKIVSQDGRQVLSLHSTFVTDEERRKAVDAKDAANNLRVFELENGKHLTNLIGHSDIVECVCLSPDGRRAVSASLDKTLRVWDLESGKCLRTLQGHADPVYGVGIAPDSKRAVSASADNTLKIWDIQSGKCLRTLRAVSDEGCPTEYYGGICFTPDGGRLVVGCLDNNLASVAKRSTWPLRVWDLKNGKCLHVLKEHDDVIVGISITRDGRMAISGSEDNTLRLWDLDTGKCLAVYCIERAIALVIASVSQIRAEGWFIICTRSGEIIPITLSKHI